MPFAEGLHQDFVLIVIVVGFPGLPDGEEETSVVLYEGDQIILPAPAHRMGDIEYRVEHFLVFFQSTLDVRVLMDRALVQNLVGNGSPRVDPYAAVCAHPRNVEPLAELDRLPEGLSCFSWPTEKEIKEDRDPDSSSGLDNSYQIV